MSLTPPAQDSSTVFRSPTLCANTARNIDKGPQCHEAANLVCGSCRLVQYCSKACQAMNWPQHRKICKSDLMKSKFIPNWIKEHRAPSWVSDSTMSSNFGVNQYLWGNMPAVNLLNREHGKDANTAYRDTNVLFAASGDLRNVVKTIVDGIPEGYDRRCTLVINDANFAIVARNTILLFVALSLDSDEAAAIMIHLWYSALLPRVMLDTLQKVALGRIEEVREKIKDKPPTSLQAKTFFFGTKTLRLVLRRYQWNDLKKRFHVPSNLTQEDAQVIRRRVMLAPVRVDYLHRALCNQPPPMRVATITFREDGILLPHGASRKDFDTPNPTFYDEGHTWPMQDDASPAEGWDYYEFIKFVPKASNDVMGGLFFFLGDTLSRFCKRIKETDVHLLLFNVDARDLPSYLSIDSPFDCIEVSNICDRGYVGPEKILSTFGPFLQPKTSNPHATLLMLFVNAVGEVCYNNVAGDQQRSRESWALMQKFIPITPMSLMSMIAGGTGVMNSPEMIRISTCYTMFGDIEKAFETFLEEVQMRRLTKKYGMRIKRKHTIIQPWPLRVTNKTSKEEFEIRCASSHSGCERYMEFERP